PGPDGDRIRSMIPMPGQSGIKRAIIFVHRWLGVALCLPFLLWFPSGIVMMYWGYPEVTAEDRLERSPAIDSSAVRLTPVEELKRWGLEARVGARLNTFDGRPVYRFQLEYGESIVYADTGDDQISGS